jgi:hypothetical protein
MSGGTFATPRPVPHGRAPVLAGTAVVAVALPVFLVAGWKLEAWAIAAALWAVNVAIGVFISHVRLDDGNLAAAGLVAVARLTRAAVLVAILIVIAVKDSGLGLPAAIVYGLAFTVELVWSLLAYFGGEMAGTRK